MARPPRKTKRSRRADAQWIILAAILLAGLLARVAYLQEIRGEPHFSTPIADAAFHDYWARALLSGNWTPPAGEADPRIYKVPYLRPPGYTFFLALVYKLGGGSYVAPRIAQFALGLLNCVLLLLLGRRLFGRTAGLVAAGFGALYWATIYFEGELQAPALIQTLALLTILALLDWLARPALARALLGGILLGLLAIVRANALLFIPVAALWMVWAARREQPDRRILAPLAAFAIGCALPIAPVTLRNLSVSGDPVLISCNGAVNFYIGNNEEADGVTPRVPGLQEWTGKPGWSWFAYDRIVKSVAGGDDASYSAASRFFVRKGLDFIRSHPYDFARLTLKRAALFWGPDEISNNKVIRYEKRNSRLLRFLPGFPVVLSLGLLGAVSLWFERRRVPVTRGQPKKPVPRPAGVDTGLALVALFILVYFASFLPFLVAARFRVPLMPFLFLFAAHALVQLVRSVRTAAWGTVAAFAGGWIALFLLANVSIADSEVDEAWWHTDRGTALARDGRTEDAIREFHAALLANPGFVDAHVNLASAFVAQGTPEQAIPHLQSVARNRPQRTDVRKELAALLIAGGRNEEAARELRDVVKRVPDDADAHFELGRALTEMGDFAGGIDAFRRALELDPDRAVALVNIGGALAQQGRHAEAIEKYNEALAIDPYLKEAHFFLGNAQQAIGQLGEAEASFRQAARIDPAFIEPLVHLGNLMNEQGRYDDAINWYRKALAVDPNHVTAQFNLSGSLANQGQREEAISVLEALLRVAPGYAPARQRLDLLRE